MNTASSTNGAASCRSTSAKRNGSHRRVSPSPNGHNGSATVLDPPSSNGHNGAATVLDPPSPNGHDGASTVMDPPSPNGHNGASTVMDSPSPNGQNGRDTRGRFAQGNRGGPGNPFARRVAEMRKTICAAVTPEDLQVIVQRLLRQAKTGDLAAAKLLFAYVVGRPAETVDPDTLDLKEWQVYQESPVTGQALFTALGNPTPAIACALIRAILPVLTDEFATRFIEEAKDKKK
jgi:hypothetical protein